MYSACRFFCFSVTSSTPAQFLLRTFPPLFPRSNRESPSVRWTLFPPQTTPFRLFSPGRSPVLVYIEFLLRPDFIRPVFARTVLFLFCLPVVFNPRCSLPSPGPLRSELTFYSPTGSCGIMAPCRLVFWVVPLLFPKKSFRVADPAFSILFLPFLPMRCGDGGTSTDNTAALCHPQVHSNCVPCDTQVRLFPFRT